MKKKIGSFSLMKRMNIALILNLIREKGVVSRIDIAKETGLTAATVTNLTAELIDNNLVEEFSTGLSTGGRKPILLKINSAEFCIASASVTTD
ncbi:MAG: winged helix-turn-helix transcriptional regulator [Clostridia bacterium]|nr:winged helix-turn-helix transcriptional regulator [Clostridia bacterium]